MIIERNLMENSRSMKEKRKEIEGKEKNILEISKYRSLKSAK